MLTILIASLLLYTHNIQSLSLRSPAYSQEAVLANDAPDLRAVSQKNSSINDTHARYEAQSTHAPFNIEDCHSMSEATENKSENDDETSESAAIEKPKVDQIANNSASNEVSSPGGTIKFTDQERLVKLESFDEKQINKTNDAEKEAEQAALDQAQIDLTENEENEAVKTALDKTQTNLSVNEDEKIEPEKFNINMIEQPTDELRQIAALSPKPGQHILVTEASGAQEAQISDVSAGLAGITNRSHQSGEELKTDIPALKNETISVANSTTPPHIAAALNRIDCKDIIDKYERGPRKAFVGQTWLRAFKSLYEALQKNRNDAMDRRAEASLFVFSEIFSQSSGFDSKISKSISTCAVDAQKRTILMKLITGGFASSLRSRVTWNLFAPNSSDRINNITDSLGNNLLHLAVLSKDPEILKLVFWNIEKDVAVEILHEIFVAQNSNNQTPVQLARDIAFVEARKYLVALYRTYLHML